MQRNHSRNIRIGKLRVLLKSTLLMPDGRAAMIAVNRSTVSPANGYNTPPARNRVMNDNEGVSASKIVGFSAYNDQDQKIGSIDDLAIGSDTTLSAATAVRAPQLDLSGVTPAIGTVRSAIGGAFGERHLRHLFGPHLEPA